MTITTFVDISARGVRNAIGFGFRVPNVARNTTKKDLSTGVPVDGMPWRESDQKSGYSSTRLQFPFNVESDPHQGHYIIFDIKKYKPAKLEGLRKEIKTLEKALNNVERDINDPDRNRFRTAGTRNKELDIRRATISNQLLEKSISLEQAEAKGEGFGSQESGRPAGRGKKGSAIELKQRQTRSTKASIALYMPPSVSTSYKVNYGDQEIALHTETGLAAFEAFMADQGGFISRAQSALDAAKGGLKDMMTKGALKMMDTIAPGARVLGQIATGKVITPRMELMFESVGRRSFSYTFIFIPKSYQEAVEVEKIVYQFKHAMHPKFVGAENSIRSMKIPDTFEISYMNNNGENAFLNKISSCFLSSMDVQYGADRYTSYGNARNKDGKAGAPPQRTQITLNFSELAILTQQDIEAGY